MHANDAADCQDHGGDDNSHGLLTRCRCHSQFVLVPTHADFASTRTVSRPRVGEATSSGDLHVLEANSVYFLTPASIEYDDGLGETVEVAIHDSKTGPGRHAAFVYKTVGPGALEGGRMLPELAGTVGVRRVHTPW